MYTRTFFLLFCFLLSFSVANVYGKDITISANASDIIKYNNWLADEKCININNYQSQYATSATIQLLIICKALSLGGIKNTILLKPMPNYSRSLFEAKKGRIAIPSNSIWRKQINPDEFFYSMPIFKSGEFQKGFFTLPEKRIEIEKIIELNKLTGISELQTLKNYTVITSPNWIFDVAAVTQLGMNIVKTSRANNMCEMLEHERGNLYFGELIMNGKESLTINCNGLILEPIKGLKAVFSEPRHFVISKKFPDSEKIFNALEKGLEILKKRGEIERALYPVLKNKEVVESWIDLLSIEPTQAN